MPSTTEVVSLILALGWQGVFNTSLGDNICQWHAQGQLYSQGNPVSSTHKNWLPQYGIDILLFVTLTKNI